MLFENSQPSARIQFPMEVRALKLAINVRMMPGDISQFWPVQQVKPLPRKAGLCQAAGAILHPFFEMLTVGIGMNQRRGRRQCLD